MRKHMHMRMHTHPSMTCSCIKPPFFYTLHRLSGPSRATPTDGRRMCGTLQSMGWSL